MISFLSDGIYNSGISPSYSNFRSKFTILGIGDTISRKDLSIKSLQNNSVAFLGNKFTIRAEIQAIGYKGIEMNVLFNDIQSYSVGVAFPKIRLGEQDLGIRVNYFAPFIDKNYTNFSNIEIGLSYIIH